MHYINEVHTTLGSKGWAEWVVDSLLLVQEQLADLNFTATAQQHAVQCDGPPAGETLTLRSGAAKGAVIPSTPTLQRLKDLSTADEDFFPH